MGTAPSVAGMARRGAVVHEARRMQPGPQLVKGNHATPFMSGQRALPDITDGERGLADRGWLMPFGAPDPSYALALFQRYVGGRAKQFDKRQPKA